MCVVTLEMCVDFFQSFVISYLLECLTGKGVKVDAVNTHSVDNFFGPCTKTIGITFDNTVVKLIARSVGIKTGTAPFSRASITTGAIKIALV